jgi:hypothetical protein
MAFFAQPAFALAFGLFFFCAETCLHLGDILASPTEWLAWPLYDWAAGLFLVYAAVRSQREWSGGRATQAAAWGFNASLLFGAFVGMLEEFVSGQAEAGLFSPVTFLVLVALMLVLALLGLLTTLAAKASPESASIRS